MNSKRRLMSLFTVLCLLFGGIFVHCTAAAAEKQEKKHSVVRVGFPIQDGLTGKDEDGNYTGYTVDYLKELTKYTDWDVEYVEVDGDLNTQILTLMDMLRKGEIDMLGAMNYSDELAKGYLYPTYYYGTAYTTLAVKEDATLWLEDDYHNWGKLRVAVYPEMKRRVEMLKKFAEVSGIKYEIVEVKTYEDMVNAVLEGKADAAIQIDISMEDGLRAVARFNPNPYYFAINKERADLLQEMNTCMDSVQQAYPNLQTELYTKYFTKKGTFHISDINKHWVSSLGPFRVLFFDGNAPIQYVDRTKGVGMAGTFFKLLHEKIGLNYDVVIAKNYQEGRRLIDEGKVDLVAAVPADALLTTDCSLKLSLPYFNSNGVLVSAAEGKFSELEHQQNLAANVKDMMGILNDSPDMCALLDVYSVNYYLRKEGLYDNLSVDWSVNEPILYSIGFVGDADKHLVAIINSFVRNLSNDAKQQMLYMSTGSSVNYSAEEFIYVHRWGIIFTAMIVGFFISLLSLYLRNKELKRTNAESERLYQFSMMTNECLFEYDYKRDKLMLQNNHILFPEEHIINNFMRRAQNHTHADESEKRCMDKLVEMLQDHKEQDNVLLNLGGVDAWYKMKIVYISEDHAVGRILDDSQDVRAMQALEKKASMDPLTGLMNRAALERELREYLEEGMTEGVYLLLDLDNFKCVNDTFGHQGGDELLIDFAKAVDKEFRKSDLKARLGGDEFVVFMPNLLSEQQLSGKLEKFIRHIREVVFRDYGCCGLSVSVGAAYISDRANSAENLYQEADAAMYVAKYGGKNDYYISDGTSCMRRECIDCKPNCRRKQYLKGRGITDPIGPGREGLPGRCAGKAEAL